MADIGALIAVMQNSLKEISEAVEQGYTLTHEEVTHLLNLQEGFVQIRSNDIRNEVLSGIKLKELSEKWGISSAGVCQLNQENK